MNKIIIVEDISCLSLFRRKCHYLEWCGEIDLKRNSKYILAAFKFSENSEAMPVHVATPSTTTSSNPIFSPKFSKNPMK